MSYIIIKNFSIGKILQKLIFYLPYQEMCKIFKKFTLGEKRNLSFIWKYFFALTSHNFQNFRAMYEDFNCRGKTLWRQIKKAFVFG